jgi:hypothetical protein
MCADDLSHQKFEAPRSVRLRTHATQTTKDMAQIASTA